jgi:hypothetical protein
MELTQSFAELLRDFIPVFTAPTSVTFAQIVVGWIISPRHRFITEVIFSGGNVGEGHWSRFHRFFSQAAWDPDHLSLLLAKMIVSLIAPGATLAWAVDDTLCRKRGLNVYGAGMHHDPLISSRAKPLVSWGHDWVVLCLIVNNPFWAPTKVFALPVCQRLYINRQGLTKGKKGKGKGKQNPNHRTRPELAIELINLVSGWFPNDSIVITGDSAYGGKSVLSKLPANVHLISHVHSKGVLYELASPRKPGEKGAARKKGKRLPSMAEWAADESLPWTVQEFDQFGLHTDLAVKTRTCLYYTAGKDRPLIVVLTRDLSGKRPVQMFYCTNLEWDARQILATYACRWSIECTFEACKQYLGLEDPANRLPEAVRRTAPMAMFIYSLIVIWFHVAGHRSVTFPFRPWYTTKNEPSFGDMLTTLRRLSYEENTARVDRNPSRMKAWISQVTELLSRAG